MAKKIKRKSKFTPREIYEALRDYPIDANLKKLNSIERTDIIRKWVLAHF
jgi:hypothetical protein